MSITHNELESFHRFAAARLDNGGVPSLEECLRQWRAVREEEELVADVQRSLDDIEAGRVHTLEEAVAEIRRCFANDEDEAVADIREGLAQADAGMLRPFREVDAELRAKYGISVDE